MSATVDSFLEYIRYEKGLSDHTLAAYRRDLAQFHQFLQSQKRSQDPREISKQDIMRFLSSQLDQGASHATIARKLSTLKTYYKFLILEGYCQNNPTIDLETPKIKRKLPVVLSIDEVDKLMEQPQVTNPLGLRDRAMLELMYGTGVAVSELLSLQIEDVNLMAGFLRCFGKGRKERIVPVNQTSVEWVQRYLPGGAADLEKIRGTNLVSQCQGQRHEPARFFQDTAGLCGSGGPAKRG
jgi:integrase/recombinase XerD